MKYRFEYSGKLECGEQQSQVVARLAKIFAVSSEDIAPIFSRTHQFIRSDLDAFTANAYLQRFKSCGAIGNVIPEEAEPQVSKPPTAGAGKEQLREQQKIQKEPLSVCPKCGSSRLEDGECGDCGIIVEKYLRRLEQQADNGALVEAFSAEDIVDQKSRRQAVNWLVAATMLITAIGITDGFFQQNYIPFVGRVDFGLVPYILAHLVLLRGCFLYAVSKGYDSRFGLWGLLSFAGLSVLLLLSDRDQRYNVSTGKQKIFAVICIGMCVYWALGFIDTSVKTDGFFEDADKLALGRSEHPSAQLDSENRIYLEEHKEIVVFFESTLELLKTNDYRSTQVNEIGGRMFHELARYLIWRNYQRYLHTIAGINLPDALKSKQEKILYRDISAFFSTLENRRDPLGETALQWTMGESNWENPNKFWGEFRQYQILLWNQYRSHFMLARNEGNEGDLTLENFEVPAHKKITASANKYTITFSTAIGPLAQNPLTMAFYLQPYEKLGRQQQRVVVDIISYELPQRYIQQPFNVLETFRQY